MAFQALTPFVSSLLRKEITAWAGMRTHLRTSLHASGDSPASWATDPPFQGPNQPARLSPTRVNHARDGMKALARLTHHAILAWPANQSWVLALQVMIMNAPTNKRVNHAMRLTIPPASLTPTVTMVSYARELKRLPSLVERHVSAENELLPYFNIKFY